MSKINKNYKFFKNLVTDFKVAALTGSSRYLVKSVMNQLPNKLNRVIEYGPGDGAATLELLKKLGPDGKLLAIEANYDFVQELSCIKDPRFVLVHGDACNISSIMREHNFQNPEAVIASIPFSLLAPEQRDKIIEETQKALIPSGKFIVFHQYRPLMKESLRKHFPSVTTKFEFRNVMPCYIFCAKQ